MTYFQPEQPNDFSSKLPTGFNFDTEEQFLNNIVILQFRERNDFKCFKLVRKNRFTVVVIVYQTRLTYTEKILGCINVVGFDCPVVFDYIDPLPGSFLYNYTPRFYINGELQEDK